MIVFLYKTKKEIWFCKWCGQPVAEKVQFLHGENWHRNKSQPNWYVKRKPVIPTVISHEEPEYERIIDGGIERCVSILERISETLLEREKLDHQ